ncbi:hypothetical protein KY290_004953 [Solanum tuberosum]|uniref:DUF4283 domain-containing protein n=2 Tax=Solanum tuberosum TaxID=4113 RepID=A0ABQ7WCP7_SOLTU|nr:hypothetical protein KY290_004953 [Solanum tuberosum]
MQEVRKLLPIQLGTQGRCLVGWLARRHILVRFDRYNDYVSAAAKTVQYLLYNGLQKQFRVFPWTIGFNQKEETSRAFVWISFPNLPPKLFAKQSLLSIASAAAKPIAIDKATQDKSRPSTARFKVELDLLANLPHRMRIQYVNQKTGKSVEQFQKFVYDNLPFYCNFCKYQGHTKVNVDYYWEIMQQETKKKHRNGVHDQVVVARDLECQNKENFGQLLGKAVAHESASGDQSLTTRNTLVLESQIDFKQQSNSNTVENKSVTGARLGVKNTREISINNEGGKTDFLQIDSKSVDDIHSSGNKVGAIETLEKKLNKNQLSLTTNPTLVHIDDEGQNNLATIVASTIDDGHQLNGTRGDVVLIGKSGHPLATNTTVDLALDPVNAKVVADGPQHDAQGVETIECLVDNMTQWGSGTGATSTLRWIDIANEEEEQVTSPPIQKKLSPTAPAFMPSSAKLVTPPQGLSPSTNVAAILSNRFVSSNIEKLASLAPININKQLQVGGSSTLSPNKFANLDDDDISDEGDEEEMLDYRFAIAARNADISPRQQRNNKTKHERKYSWDGKVTEEFVPRQLPMRLAKQNHMTISTTST